MTFLLCFLFLTVGLLMGWVSSEKYTAFMNHVEHDFEDLFKENPHPEIFNKDGKVNRGDYISIQFEAGYDPEEWDPSDLHGG